MTSPQSANGLILITGGTGKTGSRIAKRLIDAGFPVRIGSRSADPAFDWYDRETWAVALQGVSAVYVAFQPDLAAQGALKIVEPFFHQALAAGAKKIVLLSGRGEEEAQDAENALIVTGADWTILRASWFNQNFSEVFIDWMRAGTLALPVQPIPEPFIDVEDIAEIGFRALTQDGHSRKLYEITGSRAITFADAIAEIARVTGRDIKFVTVTPEEFRADCAANQVPGEYVDLMIYLFTTILDGRNVKPMHGVEQALGRPPRDFSDFVRETAATGIWEA